MQNATIITHNHNSSDLGYGGVGRTGEQVCVIEAIRRRAPMVERICGYRGDRSQLQDEMHQLEDYACSDTYYQPIQHGLHVVSTWDPRTGIQISRLLPNQSIQH